MLVLASLSAVSCKMGPDYKRPEVALPVSVRGGNTDGVSMGAANWKDVFTDPVLQGLIQEALENNRDLVAATYRIEEARAFAGATNSAFFPELEASGSATRSRTTQETGQVFPGANPYSNRFNVSGLLSYEIDLWGRVRRSSESARARLLASEYAQQTVISSLIAEVATAYVDLRSFDMQLNISLETLASRQKSYALVQERTKQGVSSDLELNQSEVLLRQAEVAVPSAERAIKLKENEICLLLGRNPGGVARGKALDKLTTSVGIAAGLPTDLLARRPDVLAAEQELISANADIGVAKAAYFPALTLTGNGGYLSADMDQLFEKTARTWAITPTLTAPIFNAGRIGFGVKSAEAIQKQTLAAYEKAIQSAFREAADALISFEKTTDILSRQTAYVAALQRVSDLANTRYDGGASSYLEVLDAQRNLFEGQLQLTNARRVRLQSVVAAYRALGGGWSKK